MPPLPKHIVFVLDTSGSMEEEIKRTNRKEPKTTKLKLMQDAMEHILDELQANDSFNIVQFSTYSYVLDFDKDERRKIKIKNYRNPFTSMNMVSSNFELYQPLLDEQNFRYFRFINIQ